MLAGLEPFSVAEVTLEVTPTKKGSPKNSETPENTRLFNVSAGTRTQDLRIKSPLLYQLSYAHKCRSLRRS